jgi:hypothetical protein
LFGPWRHRIPNKVIDYYFGNFFFQFSLIIWKKNNRTIQNVKNKNVKNLLIIFVQGCNFLIIRLFSFRDAKLGMAHFLWLLEIKSCYHLNPNSEQRQLVNYLWFHFIACFGEFKIPGVLKVQQNFFLQYFKILRSSVFKFFIVVKILGWYGTVSGSKFLVELKMYMFCMFWSRIQPIDQNLAYKRTKNAHFCNQRAIYYLVHCHM